MLAFLAVTLLGGVLGLFFVIYCLKKGQLEDLEEVKYQVFREED